MDKKSIIEFLKSPRVVKDLAVLEELDGRKTMNKHVFLNNVRRKHRNRQLTITSSVAAAILFLSFSLYHLIQNNDEKVMANVTVVEEKADSVSNGVQLVLSSGDVVSLNKEVDLIEEGSSEIVMNQRDRIVYSDKKNAKSADAQITYNTLIVPKGDIFSITLADGSMVTLNSDSKLIFPTSFNGNCREVILEGEAYFSIAKNKTKPFIVTTGKLKTQVLGTEFNIRSYPDNVQQHVTLVEGKIAVDVANELSEVLAPGDMLSYNTETNQNMIRNVDVSDVTAWLNGSLVFIHEDLKDIVKKLSRRFNVSIRCEMDVPITFYYRSSSDVEVEDVLNAFQMSGRISYTKDSDGVYIIKYR